MNSWIRLYFSLGALARTKIMMSDVCWHKIYVCTMYSYLCHSMKSYFHSLEWVSVQFSFGCIVCIDFDELLQHIPGYLNWLGNSKFWSYEVPQVQYSGSLENEAVKIFRSHCKNNLKFNEFSDPESLLIAFAIKKNCKNKKMQ